MKNFLANEILFNEEKNFWQLKEQEFFNYSDGDNEENYILETVKNSTEQSYLNSRIKDWPSDYHLTEKRKHLLEIFDFNEEATVLEVGCGCGAISAYIGNKFKSLSCVEGSPRRAEITALRTKKFKNVQVITAPFQKLKFTKKFDIIFCIGVLEYSPLFVKEDNPFKAMVDNFSNLLTENGTLVIAIENKLGLKYFSGANEDHAGRPYEGIEGYPKQGHKFTTFGKSELSKLLNDSSFKSLEYFLPFPDYKLPDLVISENIIKRYENINFGEIVAQFQSSSDYFHEKTCFDKSLAWLEVGNNHLIPELANSFLVVASKSNEQKNVNSKTDIMFWSSNKRKPGYKTIAYSQINNDKIKIIKEHIDNSIEDSYLKLRLNETEWVNGYSIATSWHKNIYKISFDCFASQVLNWQKLLGLPPVFNNNENVPGNMIDVMPWNIIDENGSLKVIDQEWVLKDDIPASYILIRGLFHFFNRYNISFKEIFDGKFYNLKNLITAILKKNIINFSKKEINQFIKLEADFHSKVFNKNKRDLAKNIRSSLNTKKGYYKSFF
jgi:SAM-dependent methyltransferase